MHPDSLLATLLRDLASGKGDDAARLYREVLQAAPRTHDALHMLGVVELGAGNLEEAERLIVEARGLRAPYQTIDHNLQLVQEASIQNKNIFDVLMEACKVCSLGQITKALFEVGGQYRRNM